MNTFSAQDPFLLWALWNGIDPRAVALPYSDNHSEVSSREPNQDSDPVSPYCKDQFPCRTMKYVDVMKAKDHQNKVRTSYCSVQKGTKNHAEDVFLIMESHSITLAEGMVRTVNTPVDQGQTFLTEMPFIDTHNVSDVLQHRKIYLPAFLPTLPARAAIPQSTSEENASLREYMQTFQSVQNSSPLQSRSLPSYSTHSNSLANMSVKEPKLPYDIGLIKSMQPQQNKSYSKESKASRDDGGKFMIKAIAQQNARMKLSSSLRGSPLTETAHSKDSIIKSQLFQQASKSQLSRISMRQVQATINNYRNKLPPFG